MRDGGIDSCQSYEDAADEVDQFINEMLTWYNDLLEKKTAEYEDLLKHLEDDWTAANDECTQAAADQKALIDGQFRAIQQQLDDQW